jgi:glycerol-3-phosphate acyltransferase PlsY
MPALGLLLSYLLGSIPFALIAGRLLKGIDLRDHGSGNLGATNVYRALGAPAAIAVLLLDAAKGAIPAALFAPWFAPGLSGWWSVAFGVAAIAGHVRPVFLRGKGGGKGVATASGVFLALAPAATVIAIAVFVATVAATRFVSLGSLVSAASLPLALLALQGPRAPLLPVALVVAAFVFWTHRTNIGRLRRGEESRLGRKAAS